jgi:hypothetical protein
MFTFSSCVYILLLVSVQVFLIRRIFILFGSLFMFLASSLFSFPPSSQPHFPHPFLTFLFILSGYSLLISLFTQFSSSMFIVFSSSLITLFLSSLIILFQSSLFTIFPLSLFTLFSSSLSISCHPVCYILFSFLSFFFIILIHSLLFSLFILDILLSFRIHSSHPLYTLFVCPV